jgi:hypothetical protein
VLPNFPAMFQFVEPCASLVQSCALCLSALLLVHRLTGCILNVSMWQQLITSNAIPGCLTRLHLGRDLLSANQLTGTLPASWSGMTNISILWVPASCIKRFRSDADDLLLAALHACIQAGC